MPQATPLGYCIGHDQYFKRDDVGIIYQMNVAPGSQRRFIGAALLQGMFDRAAYGCKLFCCWCAQDIEANRFWEAMGFAPLAFRAGSADKQRVHIFWQKRVRAGDTTTAWWFPSQTSGGSIREDRLVFPIPPGKTWSDDLPRVLPGCGTAGARRSIEDGQADRKTKKPPGAKVLAGAAPLSGGLTFSPAAPRIEAKTEKPAKKAKQKNDPRLVAAARELRDRWLEHVNHDPSALPAPGGKYHPCRQIDAPPSSSSRPARVPALLEAA